MRLTLPKTIALLAVPVGLCALALCDRADRADVLPASANARIITIAPNASDILCALGAADSIVGVCKFCTLDPALADKPRVGGLFDPDLEAIIGLQPTLIILRGRNEAIEKLCDVNEIPLFHDPTETVADIEETILELGRRTGRSAEAEDMAAALRVRVDRVRSAVAGADRPRVFVTIARQPAALANILTTNARTFLGEIIALAGGDNVFAGSDVDYPQVSPEAIVARAPTVIIEIMPERALSDDERNALRAQWRALSSIPAVRAGAVHVLDDDHLLTPSQHFVDTLEAVARLLHPEIEIEF